MKIMIIDQASTFNRIDELYSYMFIYILEGQRNTRELRIKINDVQIKYFVILL